MHIQMYSFGQPCTATTGLSTTLYFHVISNFSQADLTIYREAGNQVRAANQHPANHW